jgi:hypothetical protein
MTDLTDRAHLIDMRTIAPPQRRSLIPASCR